MPIVSLKDHYKGKTIRLNEPFDLPEGAQWIVTVLEPTSDDQERATCNLLSPSAETRSV